MLTDYLKEFVLRKLLQVHLDWQPVWTDLDIFETSLWQIFLEEGAQMSGDFWAILKNVTIYQNIVRTLPNFFLLLGNFLSLQMAKYWAKN